MTDLPEGFDLEALLAPIPGDAPQGIDIREDRSAISPYNQLREARSDARDAERAQDSPPVPGHEVRSPTPFWRKVREVAQKTLTETTKDLEVAAWLTEALVRSHGLAGLAAGAQVMGGLAERYWDVLFPLPDEDGIETRVAPVTGLNGRDGNGSLIQPLYKLAAFTRSDGTPVALYQFGALGGERRQPGAVPLDDLDREAREAGGRQFAPLLADARAAHDAWQAMAAAIDERAGADGPSTTAVRNLLVGVIEVARRYAPPDAADDQGPTGPDDRQHDERDRTQEPGNGPGLGGAPGQAGSREDALRALSQIANFFRRTEPHSPLSYTLDEAVRRGRMTWPELLAEVVADMDARNSILTTLGIRPPPPEIQE